VLREQHQSLKVNSRVVTFQFRMVPGRDVPLGAATPSEGMLLKDVTSTSACVGGFDVGRLRLEVLEEGRRLVEIRPLIECDSSGERIFRFRSHWADGILLFRGERVTLLLDGPGPLLVTVKGLAPDPPT